MSIITDIFSSSVGEVIEKTGSVINSLVTSDQERLQLKNELAKIELEANNKVRELELQDIQSARSRQIEHEKVAGTDVNLYLLAWTIVIGFFALVATMIFVELPNSSNDVIFMLFGSLAAGFGSVIGYFFGSSKSSADKTVLMSKGKQ